jgi:predicted transcriptional regulator of viral defense system
MGRPFFQRHPVFTAEEFQRLLESRGAKSPSTRKTLLARRLKAGDLVRVRRGLYAVVPAGATAQTAPIDPYLVASRMATDAVLGYHTALEFHGKAHSVFEVFWFLTQAAARSVTFRSYRFEPVLFPRSLRGAQQQMFGVRQMERSGLSVQVTSLERSFVDVVDRPDLGGGWEEIWRSLEAVEFFDLDRVVEYALLLGNSTTIAKVGFFLEQHRDSLMVGDGHLQALQQHKPKQPHYLERSRKQSGRLVADWNLVVPLALIQRSWSEVV